MAYRPITGTAITVSIGIARATKGDVSAAGERFCEHLRKVTGGLRAGALQRGKK
jgi:hypothetical protein